MKYPMSDFDVIVIGGGLHGCSAALQLAKHGQRVLLLEKHHIGRHASGINAGGVRTLNRDVAELPLSLLGMSYWQKLESMVGDDCGFTECGQIKVAESDAEMGQLDRRVDLTRGMGFRHEELINQAQLRSLVPSVAAHCVGGLIVRHDGSADPVRTSQAFAAAARNAGVTILEREAVTELEQQAGRWKISTTKGCYRAQYVVNAAGAWAAKLAERVGDFFPTRTRASMILVTERMKPFLSPVVGAVNRRLSFKQTQAGTVVIGGGQQGHADLDTEKSRVDMLNLAKTASAAVALFPCIASAKIVRSWCGMESETPDHIPVIDHSPNSPNLIHVFGFSGHGFQLGPICGMAVADLVMNGKTDLPIAAMKASRFTDVSFASLDSPQLN
jgi:sarcosine oxidase, subunit beta